MIANNQIYNFFKKVRNNLENIDNNLVTYNGNNLTYRQASEKIEKIIYHLKNIYIY